MLLMENECESFIAPAEFLIQNTVLLMENKCEAFIAPAEFLIQNSTFLIPLFNILNSLVLHS